MGLMGSCRADAGTTRQGSFFADNWRGKPSTGLCEASVVRIDSSAAENLLRREFEAVAAGESVDASWQHKVEELSKLCEAPGSSRTHIAFLGTAMVAKAVNLQADLLAIKPNHAEGNPNAFSARTLCHTVLVPLSAELGFHIGVTGREPLNNQPYFRMKRLGDGTPVHARARPAFNYMIGLGKELQRIRTHTEAKTALRSFLAVRRGYLPQYPGQKAEDLRISEHSFLAAVAKFVGESSGGGRRAQAAVAELVDISAGEYRVANVRINDPSRHYPGDVAIRSKSDPDEWAQAIEVRDKRPYCNQAVCAPSRNNLLLESRSSPMGFS